VKCSLVKIMIKCTPDDSSASRHVGQFGVNNDIIVCYYIKLCVVNLLVNIVAKIRYFCK
jgi:hypothetical protein